jgi:tellurite resistance protein TerB
MPHTESSRRQRAERSGMVGEAATAGREELMEAMIAGCALIAHADGSVVDSERQRVVRLMRRIPDFYGFPSEAVAHEFDLHERAFTDDPVVARQKALELLERLRPHSAEVRLLLAACMQVLESDGIHHPAEYTELQAVSKVLGVA